MRIQSLGIFLTRRCNFRCIYCCTETGADPPDKMTFPELKNAVLQAKALGAKTISIPGEGEPLLDNNLFPLIDFACENGLRTIVFTNGSLIDEQAAKHFFQKRVLVAFKLHSLNESAYDMLAGGTSPISWTDYCIGGKRDRTTSVPVGLKRLLDVGYAKRPSSPFHGSLLLIETVIVRQNLDHIPSIARFCKELGIGCMVETLINTNRTRLNSSKLAVPKKAELKLFKDLTSILGLRFRLHQKRRCSFETNPFLDVAGNVRHCFSFAASIGNIRDMSLAELHERELFVRKKTGMMSRRFSLNHHGFLRCASRKVIDHQVASTTCPRS